MEVPDVLFQGEVFWFADWPVGDVPRAGAIVYTVWDRAGDFVYVGMSGRGYREGQPSSGRMGPWGRLNSHASGRRSGDQFCLYVCDRLVLRQLHNRLADIEAGTFSLDRATRDYVRSDLGFRWIRTEGGREALELEKHIRRGVAPWGPPLLNGGLPQ